MKHIVLVGMMGAGKSTVGRFVSTKMNRAFLDTDDLIEHEEGMAISQIFEQKGEEYFREAERRMIEIVLDEPPAVISLGGGAFVSEENRKLLKPRVLSIYLKATVEQLRRRVGTGESRPLLANSGRDIAEVLAEKLDAREPVYSLADVIIETTGASIQQTGQQIIREYEQREQAHAA